jgi:hypothetical protein
MLEITPVRTKTDADAIRDMGPVFFNLGCTRMVLSAGPLHTAALGIYRSVGFTCDDTLPDTGAGDVEVRMARVL